MRTRDRMTALTLLLAAVLAWMGIGAVLTSVYPDALEVRLSVAVAVGFAAAFTIAPLAWLAALARHGRLSRRGDWPRALRRGGIVGVLVALLVGLQVTGTMSLPIVLFAIVLALFAEVTVSYRR